MFCDFQADNDVEGPTQVKRLSEILFREDCPFGAKQGSTDWYAIKAPQFPNAGLFRRSEPRTGSAPDIQHRLEGAPTSKVP
jgi:hypothetical protein